MQIGINVFVEDVGSELVHHYQKNSIIIYIFNNNNSAQQESKRRLPDELQPKVYL